MAKQHSIDLIGDDNAGNDDQDDESWMISYLDVLTLIIAFFVLLLALTEPQVDDSEVPVPERSVSQSGGEPAVEAEPLPEGDGGEQTGDSALQDGSGVLPQSDTIELTDSQQNMAATLGSLQLQGVEAIAGNEGITLRIPDNLLFNSGEAALSLDGMLLMEDLQALLELFEGEVSVEGHTDSLPIQTPAFPSNWELSSARAISVVRFLDEGGMDVSRLRAVGYAETRPLQSNASAEGRAANRRVELVLRESD